MSADLSTRYVLAHQEAGRPLPRFSADDFVDWCVMEAVVLKATLEKNRRAREQREQDGRARWQGEAGVKKVTAKPPAGGW